jgi:hypothetical protein
MGVPLPTPAPTLQSSNQVVDPNRHQPFIDEGIFGYRRQLPGQISIDASFVRRYYEDRPANVETNGIYTGGVFLGFKNVDQNQIYRVTNNTWNTMVYSAFEVSVAKRTSRLNLLAGYTRGFQHLDGTWIPNDPASFIQPSAFPNNRGLGTIRGNEQSPANSAGSLSGTADTRSPSWQKHAFRSGAAFNGPWGLTAATNYVFLSGPYSGPVVTRLAASDPAVGLFGPPTVTLSNLRTVANPLSTTIRFAYATRGDGQIKAPNLIIWNMRVGRTFKVGAQRLNIALDGINVLNHDADQLFQSGGNQLYSSNYAIAPDGSFRGLTRQPPRSAQISIRLDF